MYSKLFSSIVNSSLMEESVIVRYVFLMLLAVADQLGFVAGTDLALARKFNVNLLEFQEAVKVLMAPDPGSNNRDHEGRRVIPSEGERGYILVSYRKYSAIKSEEGRRDYMRSYMAAYRENNGSVNTKSLQKFTEVNTDLTKVNSVSVCTSESDLFEKENPKRVESGKEISAETIYQAYPKKVAKPTAIKAIKK